MRIVTSILFISSIFMVSKIMAEEETFNTRLLLSGEVANAIYLATMEFAKRNLDISGYEVFVSESNLYYEIEFQHSTASKGFRGSPKGHPGLAVRIKKSSYEITNVSYVR